MRKIEILNSDADGNAHCIKANYYKMGLTNFLRERYAEKSDGFIATAIIEYAEDRTTQPNA